MTKSQTDPVKIWFFIVLGILIATAVCCVMALRNHGVV